MGERREEKWSTSFNPHVMARDVALERSDTQKNRVLKLLVGYHYLGALIALRHP
jgi:hypothetical protein